MKRLILSAAAILAAMTCSAVVPHRANIPDVPGYMTLKGDFHIHTRFSDCEVWPSTRVAEADYDGLDFISITDHLDTRHQHMSKDFGADVDRNTSYKVAAKSAKSRGILVIPGAELTRGTTIMPAHFNAQFIDDAEPICAAMEAGDSKTYKDEFAKEETALLAGLREARKQPNSVLIWNHPDWERQAHNETTWWPVHTRILKEGLMDGIEIYNAFMGYDPEAFHWAVEKNLAIVSGTDCHAHMFEIVDYEKGEYRPMTLVFAKERTVAGIREAVLAHRTAVVGRGCVYGTKENIEPLYNACVEICDVKYTAKKVTMKIRNNSSIPVELKKSAGSENIVYVRQIHLNAGEELSISITGEDNRLPFASPEFDMNFSVENWLTDVDAPLQVSYHFVVPEKYRQ